MGPVKEEQRLALRAVLSGQLDDVCSLLSSGLGKTFDKLSEWLIRGSAPIPATSLNHLSTGTIDLKLVQYLNVHLYGCFEKHIL